MVQAEPSLYELPELYDQAVTPGPCEGFYADLADELSGPVLELACGTGRLALPLARDGHLVVGLDLSDAMLARAWEKKAAEGLATLSLVQGDIRRFDLGRRFALIILSCNSLAHLTTTAEIKACFRRVRRHLAPGGRFAFDVANPRLPTLAFEGRPTRLDLGPNPSASIAVEEVATYDPIEQIRIARWRVCEPGVPAQLIDPLRLRVFFPQELPTLLEASGLDLVARYGDFARGPLTPDSLNQICVATRAH